jgi:hypothetical protein
LLAEALSIWNAATFQNDIFNTVIIIVIEKWLIRWRPETIFKVGGEEIAVHCILSLIQAHCLDRAHSQTQPHIINLLSRLATRFMLKICGMPFFFCLPGKISRNA